MAFYDWSKNVPTSLPTLGGTQPKRTTWSTPTQGGVQASLPSNKLSWSVADEEEDEDELRKKIAALPWNKPTEKAQAERPKSPYVSQTKEEIERKYGFTPTTQTGGGADFVGGKASAGITGAFSSLTNAKTNVMRFATTAFDKIFKTDVSSVFDAPTQEDTFWQRAGRFALTTNPLDPTQGGLIGAAIRAVVKKDSTAALDVGMAGRELARASKEADERAEQLRPEVGKVTAFIGDLARSAPTTAMMAIPGAGTLVMGASVFSSNVEEKLPMENADWKDMLHVVGSSAVTIAVEKISGLFGEAALFKTGGAKAIKAAIAKGVTATGKIGQVLWVVNKAAVGEAAEEMIEYPFQQLMEWKLQNPESKWEDNFSWKEMGRSGLLGYVSGAIFSSGGAVIQKARSGRADPINVAVYDGLVEKVAGIDVDEMDTPENQSIIKQMLQVATDAITDNGDLDAIGSIAKIVEQESESVTSDTASVVRGAQGGTSVSGAEQASVTTTTAETAPRGSTQAETASAQQDRTISKTTGKILPWALTKSQYVQQFERYEKIIARGEERVEKTYGKLSAEETPEMWALLQKAADEGNFELFSRPRGYTENEIKDYRRWLEIAGDKMGLDYSVDDPESYHRQLVEKALQAGENVPPKVLNDYPDLKNTAQQAQDQVPRPRKIDAVPSNAENIVLDARVKTVVYRDETTGNFVIVEPTTREVLGDDWVLNNAVTQVRSILDNVDASDRYFNLQTAGEAQPKQRTEQHKPVQEKAKAKITREENNGTKRLVVNFGRSLTETESDLLSANGVKYDAVNGRYYTGTDLASRKLFEAAIEAIDVDNIDEIIDDVNSMFEEPTGGVFSSKKGKIDLSAKNDAKTGYGGIENEIVADRIEKASFFVPKQREGKGFLGELVESWQRFTRGGIDIDRRYGNIRAAIFRLRNSKGAASSAIKMTFLKTVNKLSPDQYELLSHAFVFRDMIEDIEMGTVNMNDLPFGYGNDIDGLLKQAVKVEEALKDPKNKVVPDTLQAMQDAMDVMRQRVIRGAEKVGGDLSFLDTRKNYMTHAVIEYIEEIQRTGKRTAEKFYQRFGTNKDYITDPTIAYYIAMQKLYRMDAKNNLMLQVQKLDVAQDHVIKEGDKAGTLGEIPDGYSILNKETIGIKTEKTAEKIKFEEKIKSRRTLWESRISELKEELNAKILGGATEAEQERLTKRISQMERTRDHDEAILKEQLGKMEHENFVLPTEIVEAIQEEFKHDVKKEMFIGRVGIAMTGLFKRNALVNPTQVVKYNTKNAYGDFEAMLTTYPEGIKMIPRAVRELYEGLALGKQTEFFQEWVRAGQMDSGLMSTSLESLNNSTRVLYDKARLKDKKGAAKVATQFAATWNKYWEGASGITSFREQILRYATALAVHEEIQKDIKRGGKGLPRMFGTKVANYGASVPVEVLSITNMFERTLLLSNQAIGNYQDVSQLTRTLSKYAIPFGRWLEVNPMRWGRILKNTMVTDPDVAMEKGEQAINTFAKGAKVGAFTVMKVGKVALSVAMFNLLLALWNRVFFKEDDDKLPKSIKEQSHITLGTFPGTDKVMYFQDLSSFGQFSEMFGLNGKIPFYSEIKRIVNGETTFENFVKDSVEQAGGVWINSFTPFVKTPIEAYLIKGSLFPDPSSPRPIYDVAEHFFASADLKNVYRSVKGLPVKGGSYLTELGSSLVNNVESGDAATWDMWGIREDYLKSIGEYKKPTRYEKDAKALAIYYFKQALRYGDNDAAVEYLAKYVQAGGTKKTYNASMNSLDPLFGLKKEQKTGILEWMNEDQKETYERAVQNFEELKELGKEYWN